MKMKELNAYLKAYATKRAQYEEEFAQAVKYLQANYNQNTALYQNMVDKARAETDTKINDMIQKATTKAALVFSDINRTLQDHVVKPMSQEQHSILGVLNNLKDTGISEREADLYYRQIMSNYTALRMGVPMLTQATRKHYEVMGYDDIKTVVDDQEERIVKWVTQYNPTSYDHFVFMASIKEDLDNCDDQVEAFLKGEPYTIPVKEDPQSIFGDLEAQDEEEREEMSAAEKEIFSGRG